MVRLVSEDFYKAQRYIFGEKDIEKDCILEVEMTLGIKINIDGGDRP